MRMYKHGQWHQVWCGLVGVSTSLKWTGKRSDNFDGQGKVGGRKKKITGVVKSENGYVKSHKEVEKYYKTTMYCMIVFTRCVFHIFICAAGVKLIFKPYNDNCL